MKTLYARQLLAAILAVTLVGGPISPAFGQEAPQTPQAAPAKTATPIVPVALGSAKHNYTRGPKFFPNLLAPYSPISIEASGLTNSPRIDQLIHDGKLELSMQEAVELALENSMDIVVQHYDPVITTTLSIDDRNVPVNNPLTSGTGTGLSSLARLTLHTSTFNTQYAQGFQTGTTFFSFWDNSRTSSSSAANLFNPSVQSS